MLGRAFILALALVAPAQAWAPAPRMSIAVFGATGGVGGEAASQAMARGEKVTALVRDKSRVTTPMRGEAGGAPMTLDNVVEGTVTSQADVDKVFEGQDVTGVVIALGGKTKDVGETMLTDGSACIINAMKKYGVKGIFTDKNNQEGLFLKGPGSDLEYCIVRPGGLTLDPPNGIINVIDGEAGSITRADVASFCLDALDTPDFPYIKKTPCISSDKGTSWVKDRSAATQGDRAAA